MARRVDRLITHIREITENDLLNSSSDISNEEILEYMNEGQYRIQSRIVAQHPRVFIEEVLISAVLNQEEYTLPTNAFLASKILTVEYTTNANSARPVYHRLQRSYERSRNSHISAVPSHYIFRDKLTTNTSSFLASPVPNDNAGQFRITYIRRIDNLDTRRGIVSAVTDSGTQVTALTLDVSGDPPIDSTELGNHDHFCIVNKLGIIQMRNLQFNSIDTSTGVVTLSQNHTYESGESAAIGDYIVAGMDASTHTLLPRELERYVIQFAAWKIFKRDSSADSAEALQELLALEGEILESYTEINEDIAEIAITEEWDN